MNHNILFRRNVDLSGLSGVEVKKYLLKKSILKYLYLNGAMSNPELSRKTNMSSPTITGLLNELIQDDLVEEQGRGNSSGGRRPNMFGLKANSLFVLGIDMGRYTTRMAIFNNDNKNVTDVQHFSIKLSNDISIIEEIYQKANQLIADSGIDQEKLIGIGIDMPGLIDSRKGINYTYLNFLDNSLSSIFEEKFNRPVFLENDARVRALGEYRFGLAKGKKNVLVLNIGWGVGLGMILGGKLYKGNSGFAGEFSHIQMVEDGLLCSCGKRGCLETVASGTALARLAREGIKAGKISRLQYLINDDLDKLEAGIIVQAANDGDQYAISILSKVGGELGRGIAMLVQLFNPEMVILGGRLSKAGQYITAPIQQSLNKHCIPKIRNDVKVVISELGSNSGVMGAAALVMEKIFSGLKSEL